MREHDKKTEKEPQKIYYQSNRELCGKLRSSLSKMEKGHHQADQAPKTEKEQSPAACQQQAQKRKKEKDNGM